MKCHYCEKDNKNRDFIYETKYWIIILTYEQSYLGRSVVILKRHCTNLSELTKNEWDDFSELVKKLELTLKKTFDATMFNWTCLMNDSYQSQPYNPHVRWHFRPRYNKKIKFNGLIFEDPEFGHHYNTNREKEISEDIRDKIIKQIRNNL